MVEGTSLDVEWVAADRYDAAAHDNAAHADAVAAHPHSHSRGAVVRAYRR